MNSPTLSIVLALFSVKVTSYIIMFLNIGTFAFMGKLNRDLHSRQMAPVWDMFDLALWSRRVLVFRYGFFILLTALTQVLLNCWLYDLESGKDLPFSLVITPEQLQRFIAPPLFTGWVFYGCGVIATVNMVGWLLFEWRWRQEIKEVNWDATGSRSAFWGMIISCLGAGILLGVQVAMCRHLAGF